MFKILVKINILFFFLVYFLLFGCCAPSRLEIVSVILCDHFNRVGECLEPVEKNHHYKIEIPNHKKTDTWEKFSNYLYFHARETPGFLIRFNRKLTPSESKMIKDSYYATMSFSGTVERMEGFEMGEDWVGSFQYLGSIIKEKLKKENRFSSFPYTNSIFPAEVEFRFNSSLFEGEEKTKINLSFIVLPPEK
ncbi:complement regulator-acquiring protein LcpA [Leptospira interrogans serovar Hebdomadis]|uniref:complement regulator-acquiring protein LcpA n=1 Tax=Leptospira interrogans TaxID=173 RepID=UPI003CEAA4CA